MIIPSHPCQDKCPEFTDEQCCHCLIQQEQDLENSDEAKFYAQALTAGDYVP